MLHSTSKFRVIPTRHYPLAVALLTLLSSAASAFDGTPYPIVPGQSLLDIPFTITQSGVAAQPGPTSAGTGSIGSASAGGFTKARVLLSTPPLPAGVTLMSWSLQLPSVSSLAISFTGGLLDGSSPAGPVLIYARVNGTVLWKYQASSSQWWNAVIDLSPFNGQNIVFELFTDTQGSNGSFTSGWGDLNLARGTGTVCATTLSPASSISVPASGATGSITVSTPSGCVWSAASDSGWVTLDTPSGSGNATENYVISANGGVARNATLAVAGHLVSVAQDGAPPPTQLVFATQPATTAVVGTAIPTITVNLEDNGGSLVTGSSASVTLASVPANVSATVNAVNGVATFTGLTFSNAGNYTFSASSSGLTTVNSSGISVSFADVPTSSYYSAAVNLLAQRGVTLGCGNNNFCPTDNVTRAQMAVFLVRSIYGGGSFSYSSSPHFSDVQATDFGFPWIQKLQELGVTNGCGNGFYCPADFVNRDQMAIFIIRTRLGMALAGNPVLFTYPTTPYFNDVPGPDPGFAWVQRMKLESITSGCGTNLYCPANTVTRGDMAVFLMRGVFNQLLPAGAPVLSQASPSTLTHGTSAIFTVSGTNTHFVQGSTQLGVISGITVGAINVTSPTSFTVQLTAAGNAAFQPYSILAITGSEEAVLPNGLLVQ